MRFSRLFSWLIFLLAACQTSDAPEGAAAGERSRGERLAHGEILYQMHCAVCHGSAGRADGEATQFLFPPARDFGKGRFRLVSSRNGAPSDRDLVATLRRGIPGSAMPSWSWLPEEDLGSITAYVRLLAEQGLVQDLEAEAARIGAEFRREEAEQNAVARLTPDREQGVPLELPSDPTAMKRGKALFQEHCADCHGPDGSGQRDPRFDEDGTLNWARDLMAGFLKGGESSFALACRIRTGMPGSAMPPTLLAPEDEAALLAYLRELLPAGSSERLVHRRQTLRARRIAAVPAQPGDGGWSAAEEIGVVLAPLWWNAEAVLTARIAALHDGQNLAVRVAWPDRTGVVRLFSDSAPTDGAALQLSAAKNPALFGMGAEGEPTNLWHWQALRMEDVAGATDLLFPVPHLGVPSRADDVRADVPRYQRLLGQLSPSGRVDRITVEGVQTIQSASRVPGEVHANASWEDGTWSVVFVRQMLAPSPDQVPLRPGASVQLACAIWNGAAGDSGARKSIAIWQQLVLEP